MSAEARATLIVEAKTDGAEASLGKLGVKAEDTGKAATSMGEGLGGAVQELTGLNIASLAGVGGITAVLGVMKSSIDKTMEWTDTIDRLSRATGESAAETSLMATVFGDVGISVGTLESSFKVLTKNGLQPNMETFKKLAAEYQAIEDPIERNEFAMKNLGRSAKEMTEILSKTPAELDALASAAANSGKVIDEQMIAKSEELAIKSQQLQDKLDGLQIMMGGPLVDGLSKAVDGGMNLVKTWSIIQVVLQDSLGIIDSHQAALRAEAIAAGDVTAAFTEQAGPLGEMIDASDRASATTQTLTADQVAMNQQISVATLAWKGYSPSVSDATAANFEFKEATEKLTGPVSDLKFGMSELTKELLFNQAAQGLDEKAAYALAVQMGLVNAKSAEAKEKLDALRVAYDTNKDGVIDLNDGIVDGVSAMDAYRQAVVDLNQELDGSLERIRAIQAEFDSGVGGSGGQYGGATGDGYDGGGNGQASGGQVSPGMPYIVGDGGRPELFVPDTAGYVYPSVPSGGNSSNTGEMAAMISSLQFSLENLPRAIRDAIQSAW